MASSSSYKNVLLAGATGALGSAFANTLLSSGLNVTLLLRESYEKVRSLTARPLPTLRSRSDARPSLRRFFRMPRRRKPLISMSPVEPR
jgi:nucleoside-diphosphate-sugar epimerase